MSATDGTTKDVCTPKKHSRSSLLRRLPMLGGVFLLLYTVLTWDTPTNNSSLRVKKQSKDAYYNFNARTYTENSTENGEKLHCWRERPISKDRSPYDILITGSGYSATGFFAKALTAAGYGVGHEKLRKNGMSNWLASGRKHKVSPSMFRHIFLLVRHPFKVINSEYGTQWKFRYAEPGGESALVDARDETILGSPFAFDRMQLEFKTLEYWSMFTLLGENLAECFMRTEDIGPDLLESLCLRAELPGCAEKPWKNITTDFTNYNTHKKKGPSQQLSWEFLVNITKSEDERLVLEHARQICKHFGYDDC
jgi:hypothetical protein